MCLKPCIIERFYKLNPYYLRQHRFGLKMNRITLVLQEVQVRVKVRLMPCRGMRLWTKTLKKVEQILMCIWILVQLINTRYDCVINVINTIKLLRCILAVSPKYLHEISWNTLGRDVFIYFPLVLNLLVKIVMTIAGGKVIKKYNIILVA